MDYRCSRCGDEMDAKFQRSHERICYWAFLNLSEEDLEKLSVEIEQRIRDRHRRRGNPRVISWP